MRNHGLVDRDNVKITGYNSRLDTLQAVVGNWLIPNAKEIANKRIENANYYDKAFKKIDNISVPPRLKNYKIVYHLYIVFAQNRDKLLKYRLKKGIEAKIHYPIPMYRQSAMKYFNIKKEISQLLIDMRNQLSVFPVTNIFLKTNELYHKKC